MKISGGVIEDGIIAGNIYDKYGTRNPIVRLIMMEFEKSLTMLVDQVKPVDIHEVGCGEGYWVINSHKQGVKAKGSDFSQKVIKIAKENAEKQGITDSIFQIKSIYDLSPNEDKAELVICCEVLEHLDKPEAALSALNRIANPYLILSVPRETVWSLLNMLCGKYLNDYGNTPGHLQRWSKRSFTLLVSRYFVILAVRTPLPWTRLLCRRKAR